MNTGGNTLPAPSRHPRARLTPEQAADRLGIADEHFDTFVRLVDALRTPDARAAERDRLRAELDAVNEALHEGGIDYPQGAAGVRDLVADRREAAADRGRTRYDDALELLGEAVASGALDGPTFKRLRQHFERAGAPTREPEYEADEYRLSTRPQGDGTTG
jgi:hypothetical protein